MYGKERGERLTSRNIPKHYAIGARTKTLKDSLSSVRHRDFSLESIWGCYEDIQVNMDAWRLLTQEKGVVKIPIEIPKTLELFLSYKKIDEIYICGGFIRDYFIGGTPGKDIDIFVNCDRHELFNLTDYLSSYGRIVYGQYGSPRFFPFSAPTGGYIDVVPFYNFIVPDKPPTGIEDLLHNFDFSANALAYNIKTGRLYNPEDGIRDIQNRWLRAIRTDFPEKKVSESIDLSTNTVFWFRLLHFQNKLGFTFEPATEKWIIDNAWRQKDLGKFTRHFFSPDISPEMKLKLYMDGVHRG